MINDMSNDMIAYSTGRMKRVDEIMRKVPARYTKPGQSYHELRNAYLILTGQIASAADAVSRYVGGVYVDRSFAGQPGAASPLTPVSRADQQRAMTFLRDYIFAPAAFAASDSLFAKLQMQRRGFEFFGTTEDPKIHERALTIQRGVLTHLTSPVVLARISDAELYGNRYPIPTMLEDLTAAIFDADMNGKVNDFRQNLQLEYTQRLLGVAKGPGYVAPARAAAFANLRRIEQRLRSRSASDAGTRAHIEHLLYVIGKGLEVR
jgi:hypothetical protein